MKALCFHASNEKLGMIRSISAPSALASSSLPRAFAGEVLGKCGILLCMRHTSVFVRFLTPEERQRMEAGLRSSDAFLVRRCQIVRASEYGARVPRGVRAKSGAANQLCAMWCTLS